MSASQILTRGSVQRAKIQTRGMEKKNVDKKEQQQRLRVGQTPISNDMANKKTALTLNEAKKKGRERSSQNISNKSSDDDTIIKDIYQNALSTINSKQGKTGLVFDRRMAEHRCLWDDNYPECPERFTSIIKRCEELQLIERCHPIEPRPGTLEEILMKHTKEQFNVLAATSNESDNAKLENLSANYDAIYIHPSTFELSKLSVGSTIELVDGILRGDVQNGMAIIRPPGHHAMKAEYNGYCFFNNVAIAAQHALDNHSAERILIVDFDVHHGQGTQEMFYDDPRVVYFSTHRYEYGTFWPNLRKSDFDYIGDDKGCGYNFNVPLNKTGMTNADFLAIWQQILIPVAAEFQPNLIIVSAGYDAAFGCPEFMPNLILVSAGYDSAVGDEKGEMELTPAFYAHLLSPLMAFAQGKVAVILEGGYCLDSLSEGAAITLKTLLGDPCPLLEKLTEPSESVVDSIMNCIYTHKPYWKCLQIHGTYTKDEVAKNTRAKVKLHKVVQKFIGSSQPTPEKYETRDCYPVQSTNETTRIKKRLDYLKSITNLLVPKDRLCYVYDTQMNEHRNLYEDHYERPERITKIQERFQEYNLINRMTCLESRTASMTELELMHKNSHIAKMKSVANQNEDHLIKMSEEYTSIYLHESSFKCAALACGSTLQVVDAVLKGTYQSGVCIVRPPGHHASSDSPSGFCIFNNVAVAAQYAVQKYKQRRVLIVDWDIHHGNGTQKLFEDDNKVLYISLHRYDHSEFFPKSTDGDHMQVGKGNGAGYNVNIPWNKSKMSDSDYIAAFQRIIMPIAYEFDPDLVLVSAGFDAVVGDPLGNYNLTPEVYGYFTHWLSALANGKLILCLEGGYNVNSISHAMTMCTKALLGDPLPMLHTARKAPNANCIETIQNVLTTQQTHWKSLKFNRKLPAFDALADSNQDAINVITTKLNVLTMNDDGTAKEITPAGPSEPQSGPSTSSGNASHEKTQTLTEYLKENRDALMNEEMFAVVPLTDCPHLPTLNPDTVPSAFDTKAACHSCDTTIENWICLLCYGTYCSRYIQEHMLIHHTETDHTLALSFGDISVWCFKCENYIDNPILYKYKNLAHLDKFGTEMAWCYSTPNIYLEQ